MRSAIDEAEMVVTSVLTFAETERALVRAETDRLLPARDVQRVRGALARAQQGWMRMTISQDVLSRAARPFPADPVRTLDAIHLATALAFTLAIPDLRLLSLDQRIVDNAAALGLA